MSTGGCPGLQGTLVSSSPLPTYEAAGAAAAPAQSQGQTCCPPAQGLTGGWGHPRPWSHPTQRSVALLQMEPLSPGLGRDGQSLPQQIVHWEACVLPCRESCPVPGPHDPTPLLCAPSRCPPPRHRTGIPSPQPPAERTRGGSAMPTALQSAPCRPDHHGPSAPQHSPAPRRGTTGSQHRALAWQGAGTASMRPLLGKAGGGGSSAGFSMFLLLELIKVETEAKR